MAEQDEDKPKKKRGGASLVVWALVGMLVVGLGGFGITNFGGGLTAIGSVGSREITLNDYVRAVRAEQQALSAQVGQAVPFSQLQALGVDSRVLQQLVQQAALDDAAAKAGLSVGDATVAAEVLKVPAFQGASGFDREAYRFTLNRNDLTEAEFEEDLRRELARGLLTGAVAGGFSAPGTLTDTLAAWASERRGFSVLRLAEGDLPARPAPATEDELRAWHEANIARFTRPEARRITYAALLPEALAETQTVDETALRDLYQSRLAEFVQPERRLVERLVYPDEAAAQAARARLDAGEPFEALVAERGLALEDIDLGDVSEADLGAAGPAVFALPGPGVAGPAETDLGPALFRVNGILAAEETTFEEAREDLAAEFRIDAARRAIADRVEAIDDALAGGATIEDLAAQEGMELATLDYVAGAEAPEGIAAYPRFREAAEAVAEGDFPEAILLDDGGLVALRLDEIVPPAPIPFEEARAGVAEALAAERLAAALATRATEIKAAVEGGAALGGFGIVDRTAGMTRDGFVEDAPPELVQAVFAMAPGDLRVIEAAGYVALLRLDEITAAEGDPRAALAASIAAQASQAIGQDALSLFIGALSAEAGITLDQTAINAVNAQFN